PPGPTLHAHRHSGPRTTLPPCAPIVAMHHPPQQVADAGQTVDAKREILCEPSEQRRNPAVFELIELGNDPVRLLAGLNVVHKVVEAERAPRPLEVLGKEPREEERVVADVFTDLSLAVE